MEKDLAKHIFNNAEWFHLASCLLNRATSKQFRLQDQGIKQHFVYLIPSAINRALALELYIKCLYSLEKHEEPIPTHQLELIFDKLNTSTQEILDKEFNIYLNSPKFQERTVLLKKAGCKLAPPTNLRNCLQQSGKVFVKARYLYEGETWSQNCYDEIRKLLVKMIIIKESSIREWTTPKL